MPKDCLGKLFSSVVWKVQPAINLGKPQHAYTWVQIQENKYGFLFNFGTSVCL